MDAFLLRLCFGKSLGPLMVKLKSRMCILQIVLNNFQNDNRVLRAAKASVEAGTSCTVYALHESDLLVHEQVGEVAIRRFALTTRSWPKKRIVQCFKYIELLFRMCAAGRRFRPAVIHAHDLSGLPIGYLISCLTGGKLIYDSHELWSGASHQSALPNWLYRLALNAEKWLAQKARASITVCDGIALEMQKQLKIPLPLVIRNIPDFSSQPQPLEASENRLCTSLGLPDSVSILLYQGVVSVGRGLPLLIEAMQQLHDTQAVLVFLGNGPMVAQLKTQVQGLGLSQRIYFHPAVPPTELAQWTRCATIGISPIEAMCQSYYYCLPNKLFEFIQAGLPVVVSDLPEMANLVRRHGVGECFPEGDSHALAQTLDRILASPSLLEKYRQAAQDASQILTWQVEKQSLLGLYSDLLLEKG